VAGVDEFEHLVRQAAFRFLDEKTARYGEVLSLDVTKQGVEVGGERVALMTPYKGIFKPRQLDGALSVLTAPPKQNREAPYDDHFGADGIFRYHYRGDDPRHPDNVAVRYVLEHRLPLIYFYGVTPGHYMPVWPVHVIGEDPGTAFFHLDVTGMAVSEVFSTAAEASERRYRMSVVRQRLHQARFREAVLRAHRASCAVCRLRASELVDAAHIVSDAEGGQPVVPNGLALCKLHHAAFDRHILGVRPDLRIVVRRDVLEQRDGPMLIHGLQGFHGAELVVPRRRSDRPDPELLELRYGHFREAG
jgi:putative restriction endonuclease